MRSRALTHWLVPAATQTRTHARTHAHTHAHTHRIPTYRAAGPPSSDGTGADQSRRCALPRLVGVVADASPGVACRLLYVARLTQPSHPIPPHPTTKMHPSAHPRTHVCTHARTRTHACTHAHAPTSPPAALPCAPSLGAAIETFHVARAVNAVHTLACRDVIGTLRWHALH